MDMTIFQIESNKVEPKQGSLLVAAPFMKDYHFARSVVLLVEHSDEGSMGIILNKRLPFLTSLSQLVPALETAPNVPVYNGGPVSHETLFYLHTLKDLKGALPVGNGLYVNGDFKEMQQYILDGNPTEGVVRFFTGYAGWQGDQLMQEIEENYWLVTDINLQQDLLYPYYYDLWQRTLCDMGGKYAVWSRYPLYPALN